MATISVNYGRRVEYKMPVFNFSVPKINFYINTPGVSVVGPDKYLTNESEGKFSILNPNTSSIYFNNLTYVKAQFRDSRLNARLNTLKLRLINEYDETDLVGSENIIGTKHYQEYQLTNNGKLIGKLTLVIPVGLLGSNKMLLPLTTLEFSAFYEVLNLNILDTHYYGKTATDPDKRVGAVDLTFNIKCFTDNTFNNVVNEEVVISVILVKTD
jgi:hypothetical protein